MIVFSLTGMRQVSEYSRFGTYQPADISYSAVQFYPLDLSAYKNVLSYIQRMVKRPAYQTALKKGDPDINIEEFVQGPPPPSFSGSLK